MLNFLGNDDEININTVEAEFINWKWIDVNKLEEMIVDFKKEMYRNIVSEFNTVILKDLK